MEEKRINLSDYDNDEYIYNVFINNNATHTYKYVATALLTLSNEQFEKLSNAESDYWDLDPKTRTNGYKRMKYWLNKINISLNDFFAWCDV